MQCCAGWIYYTSECFSLLSHHAQCLFWPVHIDKERVGFDLIHTCHARSQSFHWIELEQLRRTTTTTTKNIISINAN